MVHVCMHACLLSMTLMAAVFNTQVSLAWTLVHLYLLTYLALYLHTYLLT